MATISERRHTDRERVKRWRAKHQKSGGRSLQVMLTPEARKALDLERKKTGESITAIVNRAILQLGRTETAGRTSIMGTKQPERDDIMAKILIMHALHDMNQSQIAKALNDKGVQTFSGKGKWYSSTIRNIFQNLREKGALPDNIKSNINRLLKYTIT
jgi:Recombinase